MSRGVNKTFLLGNLGKDPSVKYGQDGGAVTTFSMATTEHYRTKEGENKENTEWHRIVLFGRLAEVAAEHLKEGSRVYIEGRLQTRKWEKDGQTRYTTEIVCNELVMLGE